MKKFKRNTVSEFIVNILLFEGKLERGLCAKPL